MIFSKISNELLSTSFQFDHGRPVGIRFIKFLTGDCRNIDTVHRAVNDRPHTQHDTANAGERRKGRRPRQPAARHGRSCLHYVVHPRIRATLQCFPEQMEIFQRRSQHNRLVGHLALFRVVVPCRNQQKRKRPVPRRSPSCTDLPYHENTENIKTGPPLDRSAESGFHVEKLVQRTGPAHAVPGHGRPHILQFGVFRRKRRAGHQIHKHTGDILVGGHHHDNSRLRRHLPNHAVGQSDWQCMLYLWCSGHCVTHSHHCQQLCRVLQEPDAKGKGVETKRGPGTRQA